MGKPQLIAIASAVALFLVLFLGCPTQSKEQARAENSRQLNAKKGDKVVDTETLVKNAVEAITPEQRKDIGALEAELEKTKEETPEHLAALKKVAGAWHNAQHDEVAALYAQQIAEAEKTDGAWEIAGGNFYIAMQAAKTPEVKDFLAENAIKSFENALSIQPKKIENKEIGRAHV